MFEPKCIRSIWVCVRYCLTTNGLESLFHLFHVLAPRFLLERSCFDDCELSCHLDKGH